MTMNCGLSTFEPHSTTSMKASARSHGIQVDGPDPDTDRHGDGERTERDERDRSESLGAYHLLGSGAARTSLEATARPAADAAPDSA